MLEKLLQSGEQTPQRETAITMLAAMIVRGGQDAAIQSVLAAIGRRGSEPSWQRSALLRGAEVAVARRADAGYRAGAAAAPPIANAPCPTCPGGRAGPGGAYAFRAGRRTAPTAAPGEAGSAPAAEPRTRGALRGGRCRWRSRRARRQRPRADRVARQAGRGRAGPRPDSAEEQQRFNAGQEVYRNICQACHQPDGRGQERLAPSLVGSTLALAAAEIPARILLNGKEGPVGLMPPVGAALSDDQIAGVLTYIRREWGQTGTPVDPGQVKAVRDPDRDTHQAVDA